MKARPKKKEKVNKIEKAESASDNESIEDIYNDEISNFTNERNQLDFKSDDDDSDKEEAILNLNDSNDDDSDEEIGEWSKRLKQIKFQAKLDKKKVVSSELPEKSWGSKRSDFYGSGVKRKPEQPDDEDEDEWLMEAKEVEKLQQKLYEDVDEDDFMIPYLKKGTSSAPEANNDLEVKRKVTEKERLQHQKKLHPEAEPLKEELNNCMETLELLKTKRGWKVESKDTCFRLLAANIAFYLHLIESNEDCRGHPVLKRIVQWKKLAKMYEELPEECMEESEDEGEAEISAQNRGSSAKKPRIALSDSEEEEEDVEVDGNEQEQEVGESENRPITYEMEKNKVDKKKSAPNNPRVKHREKFRKAKIRRKGKIREYRPEIHKYQGEASGIRAGIVRSTRFN